MISTTLNNNADEEMETVPVLGEIKTNQEHNVPDRRMRRSRTNSTEQQTRLRQPATTGWQEREVYARAGLQAVTPQSSSSLLPSLPSLPSPSPSSAEYGKENNFFLATSYEDGSYFTYE